MATHSSKYRELTGWNDSRTAAVELVAHARRSLALFTRDLEPQVYDTVEFLAAVKQLALRSRYSCIRVVVIDPTATIKDGHRLVELGRQLSSRIELRRPCEDHAKLADAFLVCDDTGLLYRPLASRYEGFVDPYDPAAARARLRTFEDIWQQAEPEPEFRRLGL